MGWWDSVKDVGQQAATAYVGWPGMAYNASQGDYGQVMGNMGGSWAGGGMGQGMNTGNLMGLGAGRNAEGGGYLSKYFEGGGIDDDQFKHPFLPYGEPPSYSSSGGATPNREALDFLKDYGTRPLDEESPWHKMQRERGERQLNRNLSGIDTQTMSQGNQMMGNVAARGGLDSATAARLGQSASRAGMQASQGARGDHLDYMSGIGTTDLQQRLGASGTVAGLEPSYAQAQFAQDKAKYMGDFNKWEAMTKAYGDSELAQAIANSGSDPMMSNNMFGNPFGGGGGGMPPFVQGVPPLWGGGNPLG